MARKVERNRGGTLHKGSFSGGKGVQPLGGLVRCQMGAFEVHFEGFGARELAMVRRDLARALHVVPRWQHTLWVCYSKGEDGAESSVLSVGASPEYRQATITVYAAYFSPENSTPEARRSLWTHELVHLHLEPLAGWAREEIKRLVKEDAPKYCESLIVQLRERLEAVVCDVTKLLEDHA